MPPEDLVESADSYRESGGGLTSDDSSALIAKAEKQGDSSEGLDSSSEDQSVSQSHHRSKRKARQINSTIEQQSVSSSTRSSASSTSPSTDSPTSRREDSDLVARSGNSDVLSERLEESELGSDQLKETQKRKADSYGSSMPTNTESEAQTDNLSSEVETDDSAEVESSMTYRQWKILHGDPPRLRYLRKQVGYRDAYRQLLNDEIERANGLGAGNDLAVSERYYDSQIGSTLWTAAEKSTFFDAVALRGRDDLLFIAQRTGKSQLEVRQFILLLEMGVTQSTAKPVYDSGYGYHEVPAAIELSDSLCDRLEQAADTIGRYQNKHEAHLEAEKHGDDWLIDWHFSKTLEETGDQDAPAPGTDDEADGEAKKAGGVLDIQDLKSCRLLHPRNFLRLSSRIFMSHEDQDRDWETYDKYGPAVYMTAMQDFQQCVVSLTTKIVYTAAMQCSSRLRAAQITVKPSLQFVKRRDVIAAIQILGLKQNSTTFWAELPSRLGLTCFWNKRARKGRSATGYMVPTRQAEEWLLQHNTEIHVDGLDKIAVRSRDRMSNANSDAGQAFGPKKIDRGLQQQGVPPRGSPVVLPGDSIGGGSHSDQAESDENSDLASQTSQDSDDFADHVQAKDDMLSNEDVARSSTEPAVPETAVIQDLHQAAKLHDAIESRREEDRLWRLLGFEPLDNLETPMAIQIKVDPKIRRRETALQHEENWRLNTLYRPQWSRSANNDRKRNVESEHEDARKKRIAYNSSDSDISVRLEHGDEVLTEVSDGSISSSRSEEAGDTDAEDRDVEMPDVPQVRRTSLPRRSSQVAMDSLEASLDVRRSQIETELSSGDEYTPV